MSDSSKMTDNGNVNQGFRLDLSFRSFTTVSISLIGRTLPISLGYNQHKQTNKHKTRQDKTKKTRTTTTMETPLLWALCPDKNGL
jgi:hypothetical protein